MITKPSILFIKWEIFKPHHYKGGLLAIATLSKYRNLRSFHKYYNLVLGDKVCSINNNFVFINDIFSKKIMWKENINYLYENYFFGNAHYEDLNRDLAHKLDFQIKHISDVSWVPIADVAKCSFGNKTAN